jgi:predicted nucleotidyltransferase
VPSFSHPDHISARHLGALTAACDELVREFENQGSIGILLGGSVALGTAAPGSDIDIFVSFDGTWSQRRRKTLVGVEIDEFINPEAYITQVVSKGLNDVIVRSYAASWIVHDPTGFVRKTKLLAQKVFSDRRPTPSSAELFTLAERLRDRVRILSGCLANDSATAEYLSMITVHEAIDAHYVLTRTWRLPDKNILDDLKRRQPQLHRLLMHFVDSTGRVQDRCRAAIELAQTVLNLATTPSKIRLGPRVPHILNQEVSLGTSNAVIRVTPAVKPRDK